MVQYMQQGLDVYFIITVLSLTNVVNNHVAHVLRAMRPGQQVLRKRGRSNLGQVFVLGDR
jgi:hypothetical protein